MTLYTPLSAGSAASFWKTSRRSKTLKKEQNMTDFVPSFTTPDISVGPSLDDYRAQIKETQCRWCGYRDLDQLVIQFYPHDEGWWVGTLDKKQWLYIECPQCHYDWSLWKLGIPR